MIMIGMRIMTGVLQTNFAQLDLSLSVYSLSWNKDDVELNLVTLCYSMISHIWFDTNENNDFITNKKEMLEKLWDLV